MTWITIADEGDTGTIDRQNGMLQAGEYIPYQLNQLSPSIPVVKINTQIHPTFTL